MGGFLTISKKIIKRLFYTGLLLNVFAACGPLPDSDSKPLLLWSSEKKLALQQSRNRFNSLDIDRAPIFSTNSDLNQKEMRILKEFVDNIDGGALIIGGNPTFVIDIIYKPIELDRNFFQINYTAILRDFKIKQILSSSSSSQNCLVTKSIISLPAPCDFVRYKVFEAVLYGL